MAQRTTSSLLSSIYVKAGVAFATATLCGRLLEPALSFPRSAVARGGAGSRDRQKQTATAAERAGLPLSTATAAELLRFEQGDTLFEATVRNSDGLGPLYVRDSCAACHQGDGRGPGFVNKFVVKRSSGYSDASSLFLLGTTERPFVAGSATLPLLAPLGDNITTVRRLPPAVFGRGYLEAISDAEIERVASAASIRTSGVRGRPNRLANGVIGRFGVKARVATLDDFTADALDNDMGITTPGRPTEPSGPEATATDEKPGIDFSGEQVALISDYVRLLSIPARKAQSDGLALFNRVGCGLCHVVSLHTDPQFRVHELADIDAPIYSDLLLHDMGEALSDGQHEGSAGPRDFRTAPLIGLRFLPVLMHDGRARTIIEAIDAHGADGSEGRESVSRYRTLLESERSALLHFVGGL
jgi:CxxC motif-containing protein (DUF1111 family)